MKQGNLHEMDCEQVRGDILLSDFTKDDARSGNGFVLSSRVHGHMETCASCKEFFKEVRDVARAVKMLYATAPADFMEGLHEKIVRTTPRPFILFPVLKPVAATAVLLFTFLTVLSATRGGLKPGNLTSTGIWNISRIGSLKPDVIIIENDKKWMNAIGPATLAGSTVHAAPPLKQEHNKVRVKNLASSLKRAKTPSFVKHQTAARDQKLDLLHERMVQIQVKSDRPLDNVSLLLETEGDAYLEGEQTDGKILTWLGSVSQNQPVALLVPVKAEGKKTVKIKTTVVTSEGEILQESVSFKGSKKRPQIAASQDNAADEKAPGRFLVFIPSSKLAPKNLPSSGISVSVQTGSLALSDADIENVAYVPNPGGSLELVFTDAKVELTGAQVLPGRN